jgi:Cu/Ag efflux pump CusA
MSQRLFEAALKNRLMTILLVVVFVAIGLRAMTLLPSTPRPTSSPMSFRSSPKRQASARSKSKS